MRACRRGELAVLRTGFPATLENLCARVLSYFSTRLVVVINLLINGFGIRNSWGQLVWPFWPALLAVS